MPCCGTELHRFIHSSVPTAIGFGIGLGANVLARFALKYPSKVFGLILVNCISRAVGLLEGWTLKVMIRRQASAFGQPVSTLVAHANYSRAGLD